MRFLILMTVITPLLIPLCVKAGQGYSTDEAEKQKPASPLAVPDPKTKKVRAIKWLVNSLPHEVQLSFLQFSQKLVVHVATLDDLYNVLQHCKALSEEEYETFLDHCNQRITENTVENEKVNTLIAIAEDIKGARQDM